MVKNRPSLVLRKWSY
nr:unnamed protein product [Callosobruchus analis]